MVILWDIAAGLPLRKYLGSASCFECYSNSSGHQRTVSAVALSDESVPLPEPNPHGIGEDASESLSSSDGVKPKVRVRRVVVNK